MLAYGATYGRLLLALKELLPLRKATTCAYQRVVFTLDMATAPTDSTCALLIKAALHNAELHLEIAPQLPLLGSWGIFC